MDRVEFGIKLEQINKLRDKGDYEAAAKVVDTIEWRKVKKWSELAIAEDVYERAGRLKDARNICVYAYNRNLGGKRLIYKLTEISIAINDLDEADDLYNEFVEAAPRDTEKYILMYKLNKARKVPVERLIEILEEYKQSELDEQYEYELAELYAQAGRIDECVRECDDLILWFNEGEYVEKALRLKNRYAELTKSQKAKLDMMEEYRAAGMEYSTIAPEYDSEPDIEHEEIKEPEPQEEYKVQEKDYSIYDTQNIQAQLAESMAKILGGINGTGEEETDEPAEDGEQPEITESGETEELPEPEEDAWEEPEEQPEAEKEQEEAEEQPEAEEEQEKAEETEEQPEAEEEQEEAEETEEQPETEKEPEPESIEDKYKDIYEGIDEPTKEIRINTHHWNRYRSVMADDTKEPMTADIPLPEGALPKYIVEKSEMEGETGANPEFIIEDFETIIEKQEEPAEEVEEENTSKAAEPEEDDEYMVRLVTEDDEPQEEPETDATEPEESVAEAVKKAVLEPAEPEESEVIDGQMDIMQWMESMQDSAGENAPETEDAPEADTETEIEGVPETDTETEAAESEEISDDEQMINDAAENAINDIAAKLMAEVQEELDARAGEEAPTVVAEEEYVEDETDDAGEIMADDTAEEEFSEDEIAAYEEEHNTAPDEMTATVEDEDDDNDYVLKPSERRYLQKYLFINGMEETAAEIINNKKREIPDGTSAHGNIAVVGRAKTNKTDFAIDLFKALHAEDSNKKLRIAKTNAAAINSKSILASVDKIKGTTLIIENAGQLTKESAKELAQVMEGDTESMLVIITGEDYSINRIFAEVPGLSGMFDYRVEVRRYSVNELVAAAKDYAREKGYIIGEKALLKLYLLVGGVDTGDASKAVEDIRKIVDDAIEHSGRRGKRRSSKKNGGLIILKDKDFIS
ncbi:MAG: hypothetical protein PUB17_02875 [Lachnospiraceae bacterium]|nr:hypothetical protein [Lachnospiraceae bacterium]